MFMGKTNGQDFGITIMCFGIFGTVLIPDYKYLSAALSLIGFLIFIYFLTKSIKKNKKSGS